MVRLDLDGVPPLGRVRLANELAHWDAREPWLRRIALDWAGVCWSHLPSAGPTALAVAVRKRIRYAKECPSVELLQGPRVTLRIELGDCDDKAICWAALCLSLGLQAEVGGVGLIGQPPIHAVGVDPLNGRLFELSLDQRYHRRRVRRPLRFVLPPGYYCASWVLTERRFRLLYGR